MAMDLTNDSERMQAAPEPSAERMLAGIGQLTRTLHSSLRELGYDRALGEAASTIRICVTAAYVASMTEPARSARSRNRNRTRSRMASRPVRSSYPRRGAG